MNTGKCDEIHPILMELSTEGTVTTEPVTIEEVTPSETPSAD